MHSFAGFKVCQLFQLPLPPPRVVPSVARRAGVDFEIVKVEVTGTGGLGVAAHKGYSRSGLVPCLHDRSVTDPATGGVLQVRGSGTVPRVEGRHAHTCMCALSCTHSCTCNVSIWDLLFLGVLLC